jgi:hypothetical protein
MAADARAVARPPAGIGDLARLFLWMACTASGGLAAHVAIIEREVVGDGSCPRGSST